MIRLPYNHIDFDLPVDRILYAGTPHYWKESRPSERELDYSTQLAAELETQIIVKGPDTVAAFIAEPVMGAGGVIFPRQGYFAAIGEVLDLKNLASIFETHLARLAEHPLVGKHRGLGLMGLPKSWAKCSHLLRRHLMPQ